MSSTNFPSREMRQLASLEARVNEDLSLSQIETIQGQIVEQTTDKTRGLAVNLLNRFEEKKTPLIAREIKKLDHTSDLSEKIETLTQLIPYLEPEEVERKLSGIEMEVSLVENQKVRSAATQQLQHLQFAQAKPVVRDLEEFVDRLKMVGQAVLSTNSLQPMLEGLSQYQIAQIHSRRPA